MRFNIGDKVKVIDETSEGIVKGFRPVDKIIVEIDSFEYVYLHKKLILVEAYSAVIISDKDVQEKEFCLPEKRSKKHQRRGDIVEVDLHIHQLIDSCLNLTNGEMLQIQLTKFRKELERAIRKKASKIIFIHGVGQGVLSDEIRRELADYSAVSFSNASYLEYGNGATEVLIYQNR